VCRSLQVLSIRKEGAYFGDEACFTDDDTCADDTSQEYANSAQAATYCELFSIRRVDLMALVSMYQDECLVLRSIGACRLKRAAAGEFYDDAKMVAVSWLCVITWGAPTDAQHADVIP
jgi:hypothetical protein